MGGAVSSGTTPPPEMEVYRECEELVKKGECTWQSLPVNLQVKMNSVVKKLDDIAEPPFPQEGDINAMHNLACLLADGKGVKQDEERAVKLWRMASERDHIPSRFMLGEMYYTNRGIPKDGNNMAYYNEFRGVALWQSCSEKNFPAADRRLAEAHRSGVGVVKADEAKAVEFYTRATNQCVAEAWSEIGELYEKGTGGFVKDESKAAQRYTFASDHGVASAQYSLGSMYVDGRGVDKDVEKGKDLWAQAVAQGLSNAQYHMAILYANGANGFEKDPFKALGLLNHAAKQGHVKAMQQVEIIRNGGVAFKDDAIAPPTKTQKIKNKFMVGAAKAMRQRPPAVEAPAVRETASLSGDEEDGGDKGVSFFEELAGEPPTPASPMSPLSPTKSSLIRRQRTMEGLVGPPDLISPKTPKTPKSIARKQKAEMGKENYSNMLRNKITQRRLASEAAVKLRMSLANAHQRQSAAGDGEARPSFSALSTEEMRAAFDEVDTDGGGTIDAEELIAAMAKLDCPPVDEEAALEMIAGVNGNDSGELTFEAFIKMMTST